MEILIKFKSSFAKQRASLKLKDCLYRQDLDSNYVYAIQRINDQGQAQAEEDKKLGSKDQAMHSEGISSSTGVAKWTSTLST